MKASVKLIVIEPKEDAMLMKHLRCFLVVMEQGSFTRAAAKLYVTQSAISQQIAALERETGAKLFLREGRIVAPTDSGRYLYRQIQPMIEQIDNAKDKAASESTCEARHLSLYYRGAAVDPIVSPLLAHLRRREPTARIDLLRSSRTIDTLVSLELGEVDVALLKNGGRSLDIPLQFQRICFLYPVWVLPAGHPLAAKHSLSVEDLEGEDVVALEPAAPTQPAAGTGASIDMRYQGIHDRLRALCPERCVPAKDCVAAVTLARAGYGVTLVDSSQVPFADGLDFVPYAGGALVEYGAFAHALNANPLVDAMLSSARELFGKPSVLQPGGLLASLDEFRREHPHILLPASAQS